MFRGLEYFLTESLNCHGGKAITRIHELSHFAPPPFLILSLFAISAEFREHLSFCLSSIIWCPALWLQLPPQTRWMRSDGWKHSNTWRSWRLHIMTMKWQNHKIMKEVIGWSWSFLVPLMVVRQNPWRRCQCLEVDGGLCDVQTIWQKEMGYERSR